MHQLYNVCKMLDRHKCKHSYVRTTIRSLVRSFACLFVANALQEERQHNKFFIAHQEKHLPMHWQTTMCQLNSNTNWFLFFYFPPKHTCVHCHALIHSHSHRTEFCLQTHLLVLRAYWKRVCAVRAYMCNIYVNQQ